MAALSNGQGAGGARGEPARFLSLTDGPRALRASAEAEVSETALATMTSAPVSASKVAIPNLQLVSAQGSSPELLRTGRNGTDATKRARVDAGIIASPTRQQNSSVDGEPEQDVAGNASVPARHATSKTATGSYPIDRIRQNPIYSRILTIS